ncbi:hypothetical protein E24_00392 [Faustovirus]|nr:hypothetical protein PRJ_Fausto_00369 [Faustovirus]AMN83308.1 hypothetical protein E24_00392 [Faustovirus]AMN84291.1 hypothetical protein D5a_00391 [Faustovirus]AMN85279.1 hypothetical protein E23_00392 [Faustovirus]QBR99276.1 hypothetical protein [Faustovirus mariensis]
MRIIKGDVENDTTLDLILCEMANIETNCYHFDTANATTNPSPKVIKGYPSYNFDNQMFTIKANIGYIFIPTDVSTVKLLKRIHQKYGAVMDKLIPGYSSKQPIESIKETNESVDILKKKKIISRSYAHQGNMINGICYNSVILTENFYSTHTNNINAKFIWVVGKSRKFTSVETDCLLASILVDTYNSCVYKHCELVTKFDMDCLHPINKAEFNLTLCSKIHPALYELESSITGAGLRTRHMPQSIKCNRVENLLAIGINVVLPDICESCHLPFISDVVIPMARRGETNYKFICQKCVCCNKARLHGGFDYYMIKPRRSVKDLIDQYVAEEHKRNILYNVDKLGDPNCDPRFGYYYQITHDDKKYLLVSGIELFMLSGKANQFSDHIIVEYEVANY